MTYGTVVKNNRVTRATFELSAEEHELFLKGKAINKVTGCSKGVFRITLQMKKIADA
jgi:hypothetical protein